MDRLYSNQLKKIPKDKIDYTKLHRVMSLNFIRGNYKRICNDVCTCLKFKEDITNKNVTDNNIMYLVRFDIVDKIAYNKNEHKFITFLRILNCEDINDGMKYAKGDKIMEDIINYVKEWNLESSKTGLKDLLDTREREGRDEGRIEGRIETAKNMLIDNVDVETIKKYTGLSKKQILSLQ